MGATIQAHELVADLDVSIHAPVMGATDRLTGGDDSKKFRSTPP